MRLVTRLILRHLSKREREDIPLIALVCYTRLMIDLEKRLRRTFSRMAANEALADVLDEHAAAEILKWGEGIAGQFVLKTRGMDDKAANEFLAPYFSALRKMMRAIGHWVVVTDPAARLQWWNRIEQNGKTLYGDRFMLPKMETVLARLTVDADVPQRIGFIRNLIENQKAKG
jgi:hypothetical protein